MSTFLLVGLLVASGDFGARKAELLEYLAKQTADAAAKEKIERKLVRYCDSVRRRAMVEGLKLLESMSPGDVQENWESHFESARKQAEELAKLDDDKLPDSTRKWIVAVAADEVWFWNSIQRIILADARDQLAMFRKTFEDERKSLTAKWRDLRGRDASIDSQSEDARKRLNRMFDEVIKKVAAEDNSAEASLRRAANAGKSFSQALRVVAAALDWLHSMSAKAGTYEKKMKEAHRKEVVLVVLFNDTRAAVAKFLAKTNMRTATSVVKNARVSAKEAARVCRSAKQKEDAQKFSKAAIDIVDSHLDRFEHSYEKFVDQFKGVFIGAPGDKTIDELLERQSWRRWDGEIDTRAQDLERTLRDFHEGVASLWRIDIDAFDDAQENELKKQFEALARKLKSKISVKDSVWTRIKRLPALRGPTVKKLKG